MLMVTRFPSHAQDSCPVPRERNGFRDIPELIDKMGSYWKTHSIPWRGLSHFAIRGRTFMGIRDGYRSEFLGEVLPERHLIDLGAGICTDMIEFASAYAVAKYTAVDRYCPYPCSGKGADVEFRNMDMLQYLMSRPDDSANIVMNAIDQLMLSCGDNIVENAYAALLVAEIARVVIPGGIAFGMNSPFLPELADYGFVPVVLNERYGVGEIGALMRKVS